MVRKQGHCRVSEWETNDEMMGPTPINNQRCPTPKKHIINKKQSVIPVHLRLHGVQPT